MPDTDAVLLLWLMAPGILFKSASKPLTSYFIGVNRPGIVSLSTGVELASAGAGDAVAATVSCQVALADLVDLALPGQKTIVARASAPVDRYRGGA